MSDIYLQTDNLAIGYRRTAPVVEGINLELKGGEVVALIGGNGAGKSTLLNTICGELPPLRGEVRIMGEPLRRMPRHRLSRLLSIVATSSGTPGGLRVHQLVALGRGPYTGFFGTLSAADREAVREAMTMTGIYHKRDAYVSDLSDGERQKAMIARALAQDTPVMALDEPFSFLDPAARVEIMELMRRVAREKNKGIVISCHDLALSLRMASRLWLITRAGALRACTPEEAKDADLLNHLYASRSAVYSNEIGDFIVNNK